MGEEIVKSIITDLMQRGRGEDVRTNSGRLKYSPHRESRNCPLYFAPEQRIQKREHRMLIFVYRCTDLAYMSRCSEAGATMSTTEGTTVKALIVSNSSDSSSSWEKLAYIITTLVAFATLCTLRGRICNEIRNFYNWISE